MSDDFDVLVLGGGVAGTAAALAAAQQGARVGLVRAGPGASALCLGGWRGAPPAPFVEALARAGYSLVLERSTLPRPDGTLLDVDAAPRSHARAALYTDGARTLVCGIDGLPGFHAPALAALWADAARLAPGSFAAASLHLDGTPAAGWSPVSLAALLEREPHRLAGPLGALARTHDAARVLLPAVLGLDAHVDVHASVETATRLIVGEALGSAPSLPGWRLDVALRSALQHAAVAVITGRISGQRGHGQHVESVALLGDGGTRSIAASAIVLATGKFIGGGIAADPAFREHALGCDVALHRFDRSFVDASASLLLTAEVRAEPQPLLHIGVATDAAAHPVDRAGDVVYRNVFVAGSVRAGTATAALGLGTAAEEGWHAGTRAATLARAAGAGSAAWR